MLFTSLDDLSVYMLWENPSVLPTTGRHTQILLGPVSYLAPSSRHNWRDVSNSTHIVYIWPTQAFVHNYAFHLDIVRTDTIAIEKERPETETERKTVSGSMKERGGIGLMKTRDIPQTRAVPMETSPTRRDSEKRRDTDTELKHRIALCWSSKPTLHC